MKLPFQRERTVATATAPPTAADFPPLSGADIAGIIQGQRIGGDLYGFLRANPCRVVFGLLDVAGSHDENHAIVEAAKQTFHELGCKSFAHSEVNEADAMMEFCLELNLTVRRAASGVRSCPAFVGCYNEALGTICYANAGHTPGLLRDPSGVTELPATGLPLGLFSASTYEAPFVALQPGASLLLVSRGVVEASYKKEEFGLERVKQHFQQASRGNAREIAAGILDGVQQFLRTPPTHNDVTALALVRAQPSAAAAGA
jgi:serine phosphatase RsbU (regulator of sigma subunit)